MIMEEAKDINGAETEKESIFNGRLTSRVRRSSKGNWTEEEDAVLQNAVQRYGGKSWKKVANRLPGRTDTQCLHRWQKVLNPNLVKGHWSKEEDKLLVKLAEKQSENKMKWAEIAAQLPGRIGKQCRERWHNHLNPEINKAAWTKEEEKILINAHSVYGNRWSEIAKILPGRSENSVKNHWNCSLKRKLVNSWASGSALNHPLSHEKEKGEEKLVELEKNLKSPNCLHKEEMDNGKNGNSFCSKNIELPLYYTDFSKSCSIKPRRHSYTYEDFERHYTGLCYEPIKKEDLKVFLSTGKFPSTESYIRQPNGSLYFPHTSISCMKVSSDIYSSPESILRSAALSYDNVPAIIRKRGVHYKGLGNGGGAKDEVFVLCPENQKRLEKCEVFKSVGKCLEREFSDA